MKIIHSKKGYKTLVSIFALVFIMVTFLIFFSMFKARASSGADAAKLSFHSVDTELVLKTFLQTPTLANPEDFDFFIGKHITTSDFLVRTCDSTRSGQFGQFKLEATNYFSRTYGKNWHLELVYYSPDADEGITPNEVMIESIGEPLYANELNDWIESTELDTAMHGTDYSMLYYDIALLKLNVRDDNLATQVLPCQNGPAFVKVLLFQWSKEASKWP